MKTITLKIDTDNPIICPVVIGYRNLIAAQQELVDEYREPRKVTAPMQCHPRE